MKKTPRAESDPTKDRKFQQVVQAFLRTPPQPKPVKKARAKKALPRKK